MNNRSPSHKACLLVGVFLSLSLLYFTVSYKVVKLTGDTRKSDFLTRVSLSLLTVLSPTSSIHYFFFFSLYSERAEENARQATRKRCAPSARAREAIEKGNKKINNAFCSVVFALVSRKVDGRHALEKHPGRQQDVRATKNNRKQHARAARRLR